MLEIVLTPKFCGRPKSGSLGLSLLSLMVNPRLLQTLHATSNVFSRINRRLCG